MNYKILVKPTFQREAKRMAKHYHSFAKDYETLIDALEQNPHLGTDLGGGLRKIRMAITSKGRGKSGGARVITFTVIVAVDETEINLLYIYDKAERENISSHEIEELLRKKRAGVIPGPFSYANIIYVSAADVPSSFAHKLSSAHR